MNYMYLTRDFMWDRFLARDATFDNQFVTGVLSTGIYCLPSCPARKPKPENVRFFGTAEAARAAGLRACRRCRPDDFLRGHDPDQEAAREVVTAVSSHPDRYSTATALATAFQISSTRLNEVLRKHFQTTPADLLNRARVARARHLLVTGNAPILDVAGEVGFDSLSSFNEQFRRRVAMRPKEYRGLRKATTFSLLLPTDYPREYVLGFLGRDPQSPTERVAGSSIERALVWNESGRILRIDLKPKSATCSLATENHRTSTGTSPALAVHAYEIAFQLLGLGTDPAPFLRHLERLAVRGVGLPVRDRGLRIPQTASIFEGLVWSVVGQQVNLAFAYQMRRSLVERIGNECAPGLLAHPTPEQVANLDLVDLTQRRFSQRKAEYLLGIARAITDGHLDVDAFKRQSTTQTEQQLMGQRGLGPWSTHYVMMRALGLGDCLPVGDTGLATALQRHFNQPTRPKAPEVRELMSSFSPHRSLATTHLWHSLGAIA